MFQHYLKIAFRTFWKNKAFSLINIVGLGLGMAACLLIIQYVSFELSYDEFNTRSDRIYRVVNERFQNGKMIQKGTITYPTIGPTMMKDYPEVEKATRIFFGGSTMVTKDEEIYSVERCLYTDEYFFQVFDFEILAGDRLDLLNKPNQLILTRDQVVSYFGLKEGEFDQLIGKSLWIDNHEEPFEIRAVCENPPINSTVQFEMLASYASAIRYFGQGADDSWQWSDFYHYLQLAPGTDVDALEAKFDQFSDRYFDGPRVSGSEEKFSLQKLSDAHLYSGDLEYEIGKTASGTAVWSLLIIALFILVIAWVNYINLTSVRAIERSQEVGVRKVFGARKHQLSTQFTVEALATNLLSLVLALQLASWIRPWFARAIGVDLELLPLWTNSSWSIVLIGILLSLMTIGILFSGAYPAWLLTAQNPTRVLRGLFNRSLGGNYTRKALVIFQFTASIALIAGTLVVYQQIRYLNQRDLGLSIDQIMVLNSPEMSGFDSTFIQRMDAFEDALSAFPGIKSATSSSRVPGQGTGRIFNMRLRNVGTDEHYMTNFVDVDHNFAKTYELDLIAGRFFRKEDHNYDGSAVNKVILNEEAVKMMGIPNPEAAVDQVLQFYDRDWTVVGVIPNFHQRSLHHAIEPLVLLPFYGNYHPMSLRVGGGNLEQTLSQVQNTYSQFFPGNHFEYEFLDETFMENYRADQQFGQVLLFFTILAIFIACLGLFGLASYTAFLRTKEIGIRKVLGASILQLVALLSKEFLILVLAAILIGLPLAWYGVQLWLSDFAYRVELNWWLFALTAITAIILAILTVSYQAIKASVSNPVEALKNE